MKKTFTKFLAALALLVFMTPSLAGWGQTYTLVSQLSGLSDGTYCIAAYYNNKYYTVPNTTISGQTFTCTEADFSNNVLAPATGHGEFVFTAVSGVSNAFYIYNTNLNKYLVATGSKTFGYVDSSNNNYGYWTFSTVSSGGFSGVFSVKHSSKTHYMRAYNNSVRCYDGASNNGVYIFVQNASTEPSISGTAPAELAYGATTGLISYTITNGVSGGTVSASVPSGSWITVPTGAISSSPFTFTCTTNPNYLARTETVTLTYTYNTNQTKTATVTVTQNGNPDGKGSESDPFTVAEARSFIDGLNGATSENVHVEGIIYQIDSYNSTYKSITYWISDDGTNSNPLEVYSGKGLDGADFSAITDLVVNAEVIVKGQLKYYSANSVYEFDKNNQLVSYNPPSVTVEAPTFSPAAGTYADAQSVTLACETSGATIYYTTDGTDPTNASTPYTSAIAVSTTTTIKAIAVKGSDESTIATATYHINSAANPYTVAQVMAMPAYQLPANNIYVNGVVSQIDSYQSNTITYWISNDGTTTIQLEVYKGKNLNNANFTAIGDIKVGDIVTVYGNVKDFTNNQNVTTREFDQGNYLTSFTRPAITTAANSISAPVAGTSGTLNVTYTEIDTDLVEISWFDDPEGATAASGAPTWVTSASVNASNVAYTIAENATTSERSAYFRVHGLSNIAGVDVYSDVVTITQAAPAVPTINADDVDITCDATSGSIEYTITNGTGNVTAAITTGSDWLTLGTVTATEVPFTCSANSETTARTATVTLSFTGAVDKVVTVTQAANSNEYNGQGTFTKITSTDDLEDGGYYVIAYTYNSNYYAMENSMNSDNQMYGTKDSDDFTMVNEAIVNPVTSIVWKLEKNVVDNNTYWNLYNEAVQKYCYISGTNAKSFHMETTSEYSYIVTVNESSEFLFKTTHSGNRCIANYQGTTFRTYAANNNPAPAVFLYKLGEAPTDPTITLANASVAATADNCTMAITYENMTVSGTSDFTIEFCDAEGATVSQPSWIDEALVAEENGDYMVSCTFDPNSGSANIAYLKVVVGEVSSNIATLTQAAPAKTYTLATSIESGRHYIITNGSDKAMGAQNMSGDAQANNRSTAPISTNAGVVTVEDDNVFEFVIDAIDYITENEQKVMIYSIYDAQFPGFLYAAGTGANNYMKTQTNCDERAQWKISLDANDNYSASIIANYNCRNVMQYNSSNGVFSCYSGNQQKIYLYVKDETTPQYDFYMDIAKWNVTQTTGDENKTDGWYFIASPLASSYSLTGTDMVSGTSADYDLYRLNNTTWENYNNSGHSDFTTLNSGTGYLYANSQDITLHFSGAINTFTTTGGANVKSLSEGWNLIGNPYSIPIYINKAYYKMNAAGDDVELGSTSVAIPACTGVVVKSNGNENVTFSTSAPNESNANNSSLQMTLVRANMRGNAVQDRAVVSFNEGMQLGKFIFNDNNAKLYIPQNGEDYAIAFSDRQGDVPVYFRAKEVGTYTINFEGVDMDLNGVSLIDVYEGVEIDLGVEPSYTFIGSPADSEARFRIVFRNNGFDATSDIFAYQNGNEIIVSGEGELQVFDVMGRMVSTQYVNGVGTWRAASVQTGVYILRLNDKVQKIVVK